MKRIILAFLILFGAQICQAAKIFVPSDSATIQKGISGALEGDTVVVEDGTYTGDGNRDMSFGGKDIIVMSENGPDAVIIDLEGLPTDPHRAFNFIDGETSAAELVGFTIINGYGTYSHNNYEGGAMLVENASPTIKYCVFADNYGGHQGGAISCFTSSPTFINCTFAGNEAIFGGGVYSNGANPVLENCIIAFSTEGSAINCYSGGTVSLTCCDLYGNAGGNYVDCAAGQLGVNDNFSEDPEFCDNDIAPYHLLDISPCLPANSPCGELVGASSTGCFAGLVLPLATYISYGPVAVGHIVKTETPEIIWDYFDTTVTTQAGYEIEVGTDTDWSVAEKWSTGQVASSDTCVVYGGSPLSTNSTYYLRIRVNNGRGWGDWREDWFFVGTSIVLHVPSQYATIQSAVDAADHFDTVLVASGTYTGDGNWDIDFWGKNIVLMSELGPDSTIISGETGHRGFYIHSGEDSTATIDGFTITGFSEAQIANGLGVWCFLSDLTLKNCVITGNRSYNGSSCVFGMVANITHINCTFKDNEGVMYPPSFYEEGAYRFINCEFLDNSNSTVIISDADVDFVGCLFAENSDEHSCASLLLYKANANVTNCIFYNNSASNSIIYGDDGCIAHYSVCTTTVANCTFMGNSATDANGIYFEEGQLTVENTIISFGTNGAPISCDPAYINNISCTNIFGNAGGDWIGDISAYSGINGNMSLDPMFCDTVNGNYSLDTLSPCAPSSPSNTCAVLIGSEPVGCESYVCGDASNDGLVNVSDAVYVLNYIFVGGPPPEHYYSGDANCDGVVNVSDVVHVLNYIFKGGKDPCDTNGDDIPDC